MATAWSASDDFLNRLNYSAACAVCGLIFEKPRSLPCGHTFCLSCIELIAAQRRYDDYGVELLPEQIAVRFV